MSVREPNLYQGSSAPAILSGAGRQQRETELVLGRKTTTLSHTLAPPFRTPHAQYTDYRDDYACITGVVYMARGHSALLIYTSQSSLDSTCRAWPSIEGYTGLFRTILPDGQGPVRTSASEPRIFCPSRETMTRTCSVALAAVLAAAAALQGVHGAGGMFILCTPM